MQCKGSKCVRGGGGKEERTHTLQPKGGNHQWVRNYEGVDVPELAVGQKRGGEGCRRYNC